MAEEGVGVNALCFRPINRELCADHGGGRVPEKSKSLADRPPFRRFPLYSRVSAQTSSSLPYVLSPPFEFDKINLQLCSWRHARVADHGLSNVDDESADSELSFAGD